MKSLRDAFPNQVYIAGVLEGERLHGRLPSPWAIRVLIAKSQTGYKNNPLAKKDVAIPLAFKGEAALACEETLEPGMLVEVTGQLAWARDILSIPKARPIFRGRRVPLMLVVNVFNLNVLKLSEVSDGDAGHG